MNGSALREIVLGGVPLTYADVGSGEPLLVLHGAGGPVVSAAPFLSRLAELGRVIAPVHPGFGTSVLPDWIDSIDDLAYLYLDLLDALDLRGVTLIGFSMGGWIACEIAVKSTARIRRIALVDAVGIKVSDRLTRDIADIFATSPDEMRRITWHDPNKAPDIATLTDAELEIVARNREASALYLWEPYAHNPKLTRRLHRIDIPALVLWGESDGIVTPAYGRAFAERIPGARFEVLPAAGHVPQLETPVAFVESIAHFLNEGRSLMRAWYFSENAYPYLPDPATYESIRVSLPNGNFDPKIGAELYHRYLDEWQFAEEAGLDLMLNEHHATATNLNPSAAVVLGALARITKTARILVLGNPIGNRRDPVRVAEEMAMVDNYSRGRLEVGFVRGVPYEIAPANSNPVRTADRLWEAHDLIIKAWTTHDGPFNWEGRYFNYRQVNIWPRPYQQPRPPVWITATSTGQVTKIAELGHVVATFLTGFDATKAIFDVYRDTRAARGETTNNDRLAYAALVYTGDTDEAGYEGARKLLWYLTANKVAPQFKNPPGYASLTTAAAMLRGAPTAFDRSATLEQLIERGIVFAGNPDTVFRQIAKHHAHTGGYGHLLMMGQAGFLEHDETVRGIDTFAREVYPRLKELLVTA